MSALLVKTGRAFLATAPHFQYRIAAQHDKGYRQFCEQCKKVSADSKTRDEYHWWLNNQMRAEA